MRLLHLRANLLISSGAKEIQDGIPSHVTVDLVSAPETTVDEIRERMSGNICRCGAYANILAAIEDAAGR